MDMSREEFEIVEHAARLVLENAQYPEFSLVYEDEHLEDFSEEDWKKIHDRMNSAVITVHWPDIDTEWSNQ